MNQQKRMQSASVNPMGLERDNAILRTECDFETGTFLILAWGENDAGGLIYTAHRFARLLASPELLAEFGSVHRGEPDRVDSIRFEALHRLLLNIASARGWPDRRSLELLIQTDAEEHDHAIRCLCANAGRCLTPQDIQESLRMTGWGGPCRIIPRKLSVKERKEGARKLHRVLQ